MNCRFCHTPLTQEFIDLAGAPPSNSFLTREQLDEPEVHYPLKLFVCPECFLVQIDEYKKSGDIFNRGYVYYSSFSRTWLEHARAYVELAAKRLGLNRDSLVVEIASNDGYLLQYVRARGIPCLGIEPSGNTARVARERGIESVEDFFGARLARDLAAEGRRADLILGNNVLAHVPDINDFVSGLPILLKERGTVTLEFPHLLRLVAENQFDTIYHEHFSYLSLTTVQRVLAAHGLTVFDVQELPTHGGSLRVWACHAAEEDRPVSGAVAELLAREQAAGMHGLGYYRGFQERADHIRADLLAFLVEQKRAGRLVLGYGAAAKGNTLLNYCGARRDLLPMVADASPHKQGLFLPGSHIPVVTPDELLAARPDVVLILPWNIKDEIMAQLAPIRAWGGRFATAIPELSTF